MLAFVGKCFSPVIIVLQFSSFRVLGIPSRLHWVSELAVNPLASRVVTIFDKNKDENVNFKEFLQGLSIFSSRGEAKDKLRCEYKYTSSATLFSCARMWALLSLVVCGILVVKCKKLHMYT